MSNILGYLNEPESKDICCVGHSRLGGYWIKYRSNGRPGSHASTLSSCEKLTPDLTMEVQHWCYHHKVPFVDYRTIGDEHPYRNWRWQELDAIIAAASQ